MSVGRTSCQIAMAVLLVAFSAACGNQQTGNTTVALADAITTEALVAQALALEQISLRHPLNRSAASPGYIQAMDYFKSRLDYPGLKIWEQRFEYHDFRETDDPELVMIAPDAQTYVRGTDFMTMTYCGSGDVTAEIAFVQPMIPPGAVANSSTDGCEADDFTGIDLTGKIAVMQRGGCSFIDKVSHAESRGAVAVLIFNEGQEGRTAVVTGALSSNVGAGIPVVGARYDLGLALHHRFVDGEAVTLRIAVTATDVMVATYNLFAETVAGRSDQVVVIGAHLDSVIEGPGANDNGSGSVALLEVARQIGIQKYAPKNKIRFAWWGAEEIGLIGSYYYLDNLAPAELANIAMYLNADSIASHNFIRGVKDGDLSDTHGSPGTIYTETPPRSGAIEKVLLDYFQSRNLPTKPIPLTGMTDYEAFAQYGIPFGGLYTGLDEIKTEAEALLFGGTAGEPCDSCYHQACDTVSYMNTRVLTENAQAIAHFAQHFGDKADSHLPAALAAPSVSRMSATVRTERVKPLPPDRYHKDRRHRLTR